MMVTTKKRVLYCSRNARIAGRNSHAWDGNIGRRGIILLIQQKIKPCPLGLYLFSKGR